MSDRYDPRERWRWEEERQREDQGMESEGRFARHGGDSRWGTGGLGVERRPRRAPTLPPPRVAGGPYDPRPLDRPYEPRPLERAYEPRGPYTGYGPRGYHRSDERIHEDVCERLTEHGDVDARDIEVGVVDGEVMLTGTVASRTQKRLAEDIADAVAGVTEVHNRLRVMRPGAEPPERGTPAGGGLGSQEGTSPHR